VPSVHIKESEAEDHAQRDQRMKRPRRHSGSIGTQELMPILLLACKKRKQSFGEFRMNSRETTQERAGV
jgi:hypothetical protein